MYRLNSRPWAYYNDFEPSAVEWLRNLIAAGLIADGEVDARSILDVSASDLRGFRQCHFFAGVGGWSYALRLAGWLERRMGCVDGLAALSAVFKCRSPEGTTG